VTTELTPPPPSLRALAAARAAMLQEAKVPRRSWQQRAAMLVAATVGLGFVVGVIALGTGATETAALTARWFTLLLLALTGPLLAWSSARPGGAWLRRGAWGVAAVSAVLVVLTRPAEALTTSTSPEWVCTLSHLAVAVPAGVVATQLLLKNMAFSLSRSVAAGLAVGTTGALLGELMCDRDAGHIALFHLSSWALAAMAVVAVSTRLTRRSFAP
jgi:hypothetical protein